MNSLNSKITNLAIHSGIPNIGGKMINLQAKDDAIHVACYRAADIASGLIGMPFRHPEFAALYYKKLNFPLHAKLSLISMFAQIRNHRVQRKCNEVIATHPGKKQFAFTPEMDELDERLTGLIVAARALGVDPSVYLDESTDPDDVAECTNSWCLNQSLTRGKAADNIIVITDLDGVDWFVLINRQNGPGRAQKAWAGGFVDKDETFVDCARREKDEEVEMKINTSSNVTFATEITVIPVIISGDWDVRAKFVEGMENGATVTHYRFSRT